MFTKRSALLELHLHTLGLCLVSPCTVCHDQELTSPKKLRRRTLAICVVNKLILWRVNDPVHDLNGKQLLVLLPTPSATGSHLTQLKFNSSSRVISVEISQVLSHFCGRALVYKAYSILAGRSDPYRSFDTFSNSGKHCQFKFREYRIQPLIRGLHREGCGSNFLLILPLVNRIRVFIMYSPRIVIHPN